MLFPTDSFPVNGRDRLFSACIPVLEDLEGRRLMSTSTVQILPFSLDFSSDKGEILDKDGQGTGFTRVQANKNGNEYQASLIDLDTAKGVLKITTTGNSTNASNSGSDNTQIDALETQFNGTSGTFTIQARLVGPLSFIQSQYQQGGIYFGPDQDNFVKLVAVDGSSGPVLQFKDELGGSGTATLPASVQNLNIGNFASINTLDLRIIGDPSTGKISAAYAINGGSFTTLSSSLTLSSTNKAKFFTSASRAGVLQSQKNNLAPVTLTYDSFSITAGGSTTPTGSHPSVSQVRPRDGSINVPIDAFVAADVNLPTNGAGVDPSTLSGNVLMYRTSDHAAVKGVINTSGGGDAIVFQPSDFLAPNTSYTFQVTAGLKDTSGQAFTPFTSSFTTGTQGGNDGSLAFDKQVQASTQGQTYTSVVVGPDHKLYATTIDGLILRFTINGDGTLSAPQQINTIKSNNGGKDRAITSIAFDPSSTASNLIAYVSNSDGVLENAADWTGKITKLTGPNLGTYQDLVVGLPRSVRDHMTNQIVFGPDGKMYFEQAAMNAMGAPDNAWGQRKEHLLSSAILQVDLTKLPSGSPLNVQTEGVANPYNPFAANAALKIYATGVRNAYDLVWASIGHLYAPTNGSAANGNTPASPNPIDSTTRIDQSVYGDYTTVTPGITKNTQTEHDWLFDVKRGKYYGHPNPTRDEYVMNGGNPTSGTDPFEVPQYPVGTQPDRNYGGVAFDFFENYSPDGAIQYHGNAFGGALDGKLMIVRYSGGDDIIVLTPNADGTIQPSAQTGISGARGFTDPVDLTEDQSSGFIYVAEYGGQQISLLKPISGANVKTSASTMYFNDVKTGSTDPGSTAKSQQLTITNNGTTALSLASGALSISGTDASQFSFVNPGATTLNPGQSLNVTINFNATSVGIKTATLTINSNGAVVMVNLRGIGMNGTEVANGLNEPSLQRILDLFQIPDNVGDDDPTNTAFPQPPKTPNDEVVMPRLQKAGDGNVSIQLLSIFDNIKTPALHFGYYDPGTPTNKTELFTVGKDDAQSVNPTAIGNTTFDPNSSAFSLYGVFPAFTNREVYSEDSLNTWETTKANQRKVRFYPLKNSDGSVVPNAYVFTFEEYNKAYDQNDVVGIIRNVKAAPSGPEIGLENGDGGVPFNNRLVFNRIDNKDDLVPNVTHEIATLLVKNTGSTTLNISSMVLSGPYSFVSGGDTTSIAAGGVATVKIKFTGVGTGLVSIIPGTLTINSDDADEPATTVQLSGIWQKYSEQDPSGKYGEPTLQQVVQAYGYGTQVIFPGQNIDTKGKPVRIGEEILSPYWKMADANAPVNVRMLAALHKESSQDTSGNLVNTNSVIKWFYQGSTTYTTLFKHNQNEGQSLLPHIDGSTTNYAAGSFTPNGNAFGFKVDSRYSDDALNPSDFDPNDPNQTPIPGTGHAFRFYALKDANGNVIPNSYLIAQDYTGISYSNYDYQDNIYIVTNVKPITGPSAVAGLVAGGSTSGIGLSWTKNTEGNVAGYRVYRSDSAQGTFSLLNSELITTPSYTDINATAGATSFYRVTAVDLDGNESAFASASATRPMGGGTVTVNAPSNLQITASSTSEVDLSWADNSSNETGFKVLRKTGAGGTYSTLFTTNADAINYQDLGVTAGNTYYYEIVATTGSVDSSASNEQSVTIQSQPPQQGALTSADIGNPTPGGSTTTIADGSDYDVTAGGANVWGTSDQFHFDYQQVTGDFDVKVQITSLSAADPKAKAGIMARSSLNANASNAYARVNPIDANGPRLSYRTSDGGASNTAGTGNGTTPIWIRLQRVGSTFTAYRSADGTTWTKIGNTTIAMGQTIYLGLATCADTAGQTATAQYRSFGDTVSQPPAVTIPTAASNLSATASSPTQVDLAWADNSSNETGFKVQRRTAGGLYQTIFTTAAGAMSYSDTSVNPNTTYFYQIVATNSAGDATPSNEFGVNTPDVQPPPPATHTFNSNDVGNPKPAGKTTTLASDQFDVTGGGTDVWGTSDQMQFENTALTGDFDFRVRVNAATFASGANPLIGLMARDTLNANSKNVFLRTYGVAGGQFKLAYRTSTGGTTSSVGSGANTLPNTNTWLRLVRTGNTFTGYSSTDGTNWTMTGSISLTMSNTIFVGMAVSSRSTTSTATAQFRDVTIL